MVITSSKGKDQPGEVANPARGQLNSENELFLSLFAPGNLVPRAGLGRPVPRQLAHSFPTPTNGWPPPPPWKVVFRVGNQYAECEKQQ